MGPSRGHCFGEICLTWGTQSQKHSLIMHRIKKSCSLQKAEEITETWMFLKWIQQKLLQLGFMDNEKQRTTKLCFCRHGVLVTRNCFARHNLRPMTWQNTPGSGSLLRLGPCPWCWSSPEKSLRAGHLLAVVLCQMSTNQSEHLICAKIC